MHHYHHYQYGAMGGAVTAMADHGHGNLASMQQNHDHHTSQQQAGNLPNLHTDSHGMQHQELFLKPEILDAEDEWQ